MMLLHCYWEKESVTEELLSDRQEGAGQHKTVNTWQNDQAKANTHTDLSQEPNESRRRHHADLPHQGLGYGPAPLLLAASFGVRLQRGGTGGYFHTTLWSRCDPKNLPSTPPLTSHLLHVKVGVCQQVLQVFVPLRLGLLQHDHGVGLPEERASGSHLPDLDELQHDLLMASALVSTVFGKNVSKIELKRHLLVEVDECVVGQFE